MSATSSVVVRTSRGVWPLLKTLLKVGLLTVVFFFVIFNSLKASYEQGSIKPLVTEVGARFFLITYNIYQDTNSIEAGYVQAGFFGKIEFLSQLLFDLYVLWLWLRILKTLAQWAITQDDSKVTANWLIALIIFFLVQYIFILAAGRFGYLPELSEGEVFTIPVKAFSNLFHVLPTLAEPFIHLGEKF